MNVREVDRFLFEALRPRLSDSFVIESLRGLEMGHASLTSSTLTANTLLMALLHQNNVKRASSLLREILSKAAGADGGEMLATHPTECCERHSVSEGMEVDMNLSCTASNNAETQRARSKIPTNDNDATLYYPNIRCILCKEWLCSRNRYMHVESHYNYRPYSCTALGCDYTNRKEIFVRCHVKRVHNGEAGVLYVPDSELEKKAWAIAEQSLDQTKLLLTTENGNRSTLPHLTATSGSPSKDDSKGKPFRARIHNSQRTRKSRLIELGRKRGLIPRLVLKSVARHASSEERQQTMKSPVVSSDLHSAESPFLCAALRQVDGRRRAATKMTTNLTELEKLLLQRNVTHRPTRTGTASSNTNPSVLTALLFGDRSC